MRNSNMNGWSNWETWVSNLWLCNTHQLYLWTREARMHCPDPGSFERFARRILMGHAPFVEEMEDLPDFQAPFDWSLVNWEEIYANWEEDIS